MPILGDIKVVKHVKPIVFVIERTSVSKKTELISNLVDTILDFYITYDSADYEYKFCFLFFSETINLYSDKLVDVDSILPLNELMSKSKIDASSILETLNENLSRKKLLTPDNTYSSPYIYFFGDGNSEYINTEKIDTFLNENKWLKIAKKRAVLIEQPSKETLGFFAKFTGDVENIGIIDGENTSNADFFQEIISSITADINSLGGMISSHPSPVFSGFWNEIDNKFIHVDPIEDDDTWSLSGDDTWE